LRLNLRWYMEIGLSKKLDSPPRVRRVATLSLPWACIACIACNAGVVHAAGGPDPRPTYCVIDLPANPSDYRLRDSTAQYRWSYDDNWKNHTAAAVKLVQAGQFTRNARTDIEWTLFRWPNHLPALEAAIEYDLKGGRPYEFRPVECYFARGRAFAPNDLGVLMAEAVYYWKKGEKDRARTSYEDALAIQPDSADAHYNLGLLDVEMQRFDEALKHAWAAYDAGYPLSGLRNKLIKSGHWRDPPRGAEPATKP